MFCEIPETMAMAEEEQNTHTHTHTYHPPIPHHTVWHICADQESVLNMYHGSRVDGLGWNCTIISWGLFVCSCRS
ncbi:hypothetical protein VTJ04DRAFT_5887 [Mycothermus thermophilus]|uniref:uncharacterized protein n=1 Tax=Humicola insolens TaxID=85995 RepID=UPI003741FF80